MKNIKLKQILCVLLAFIPALSFATTLYGKVVSIHDGDTLKIKIEGESKPLKVRFLGIDTPEISYSGETQGDAAYSARDYLIEILPIGSVVEVEEGKQGRDRGNRVLGTIYYKSENINMEMIRSGHAVPYFIAPYDKRIFYKYSDACHEADSRSRNIFGLIADEGLEIPYEFRLNVQERTGTNLVGDYNTKKLYSPEESYKVHVCDRVFIKYKSYANRLGYTF